MKPRRRRANRAARTVALRGLAILGLSLALAAGTPAQEARRSLGELALAWSQGDFRGPMVCDVEGAPRRAIRSLRIRKPRGPVRQPTNELVFEPLPAAHCRSELGPIEPHVEGSVRFVFRGRHNRPDTAGHDFRDALRRNNGFSFPIATGTLRIRDDPREPLREIQFRRGTIRLERVAPGSDIGRLFREYGAFPKRTLTLEAPDGTRLVFHLVQVPPR